MALINCDECNQTMSSDALACPHCGKPNANATKKKQNSGQSMGCLLMVLAVPFAIVGGPLAGVVFIVGLILVLINTRLW